MKAAVLSLIFAILAINYASATSVLSLTGTCTGQTLSPTSNTLYFYLSSAGNASATNLLVIPRFSKIGISPSSQSFSVLPPNRNISFSFNTYNFSFPGSYIGYFIVKYTQSTSTFFTVFPCSYSVIKPTQSLLSIININVSKTKLQATLFSLEKLPINVSISVFAPPTFLVSPNNINVSIPPNSRYNITFNISSQKSSGSSFPVGIVVSYMKDGMHYATENTGYLSFRASSTHNIFEYLLYGSIIVIIIIILALISLALIRNRKNKKIPKGQE